MKTIRLSTLPILLALFIATLTPVPTAHSADIPDTAIDAGIFSTLVAALQAADLVDTLKGDGPFTVFAPTDEAFAKLPEGTVEGLLEDLPTLTNILLYHVVAGAVMAADVVTLDAAETLAGANVSIRVDGDDVLINEATVTQPDVEADNGVIHIIDTVLLPPASTAVEPEEKLTTTWAEIKKGR